MVVEAQLKDSMLLSSGLNVYNDALAPIMKSLRDLEDFLPNYLLKLSESKSTLKIVNHFFSSGGKRVRPSIYLLCCRLCNYNGAHLLPIAAVSEYVHASSLLHDDVVDQAPVRRYKATSNHLWGNASAVLVGDFIYSTASQMMAKTGHLEIVNIFAGAIAQMSEGELLQMESIGCLTKNSDAYFKIIAGKTAALLGASCRAAGVLAEMSVECRQALEDFGFHVGLAFQLIDDALDYSAKSADFGKTNCADLLEGKVTYPLIHAYEECSSLDQKWLEEIFANKSYLDLKVVAKVKELVLDTGGVEASLTRARQATERAMSGLRKSFAPSFERDSLEQLASLLLKRAY